MIDQKRVPKSPRGRQAIAVRWCPREMPGAVSAVRGHEGRRHPGLVWKAAGLCVGEDEERLPHSWNTRARAGWGERHAKPQGTTLILAGKQAG